MIRVLRAGERYETRQPGIVTWSCFASGPHYDPENLSFGPLVAVDEHLLEPNAGFATHPHRGVDLVTVVLAGTLRHQDAAGAVRLLGAGAVHLQHASGGLRHAETNASDREPLRILQMALLSNDAATGSATVALPLTVGAATLSAATGPVEPSDRPRHLHVLAGGFAVAGVPLGVGDSVRTDEPVPVAGAGRALLWTLPGHGKPGSESS